MRSRQAELFAKFRKHFHGMEKNDIVLLSPLDKFQLDVAVFNDRALCTLGCMYFGYLEIDFYK